MLSKTLRRLAVVGMAGVLAIGIAGGPASAAPATVRGGRTTVTTAPGIAATLLRNGILPIVTSPGREGLSIRNGLAVTAGFPVTGGAVSLDPLGGQVLHRGGIKFINLRTFKALEVGDFIIDLSTGQLTGRVNRGTARVAVFDLDLSKASITVDGSTVKITGVGLNLTAAAAGALNATLGTTLFTAGLRFGTARSVVEV
ncbi:hypothetical protein [Hamadaea tsunoensis]|uniref:hypothetical protein n=1 Tax=Hamadaea tsunoensis TaxID=53368 RepID=UPI000405A77C|nr:hypothetical protein [Hamadaea tsunoensis]